MRRVIFYLLISLLFVSCNLLSDNELVIDFPGVEHLSWVEQTFAGGQQCYSTNIVPPNTEKLLNTRGVAVYDTYIFHLGTCGGCTCPAYAAIHYALIRTDKLERANQIGFELSDGPNRPE